MVNIVHVKEEKQRELLTNALLDCVHRIKTDPTPSSGKYCNRTWDGVMCWPDTAAGTVAIQKCANYVNKFNIEGYATKECLSNGTWYYSVERNLTWSNYSQCLLPDDSPPKITDFLKYHTGNIKMLYSVGYGLSLVSLIIALAIMLFFRRLHCPRNTIHCNLFISFVLRAGIALLKDHVLVGDIGLAKDVKIDSTGYPEFIKEGTHWECKLLFTVFNYVIGANYTWILMEGIYLHMLIFVSVFSESSSIKWYIVCGWASPFSFIIPWIIVKKIEDNEMCWNTGTDRPYEWIKSGPIIAICIVNFIIFLNVVRVLFTKLRASNSNEARRYRYIKLAKSTLVLIPLFGVHYILFVAFNFPKDIDEKVEVAHLYLEMMFTSFQGFVVALLFCFLNNEVQSEIIKRWERHKLRRLGSGRKSSKSMTLTSYLSRARNSLNSEKRDSVNDGMGHFISREPSPNLKNGSLKSGMKDTNTSSYKTQSNGHLFIPKSINASVVSPEETELMIINGNQTNGMPTQTNGETPFTNGTQSDIKFSDSPETHSLLDDDDIMNEQLV